MVAIAGSTVAARPLTMMLPAAMETMISVPSPLVTPSL